MKSMTVAMLFCAFSVMMISGCGEAAKETKPATTPAAAPAAGATPAATPPADAK